MTIEQREKKLLKEDFIKLSTKPNKLSNLLFIFFTGAYTYYDENSKFTKLEDTVQCKLSCRTVDDCFLLIKYYKVPISYKELANLIKYLRQHKHFDHWICTTIHKRVHYLRTLSRNEETFRNALKKCGIKNFKL